MQTRARPADRKLKRRTPRWHFFAERAIELVAMVAVAAMALVFVFIVAEAAPILFDAVVRHDVTPTQMLNRSWQPTSEPPSFGVLPLVVGTLKVTVIALVIATPIAVLAAVYVSQIAPPRLREWLKPIIELLAGIPSVVLGVFALVFLGTILQRVFHFPHRLNTVLAGAALAITLVPLVFTIAEEALSSVPRAFLNASLALGATKMQSILRVMIPSALPGIAAGVVLGFGRALGETMIVLMASGNAALLDPSLGRSTRTITATIAQEMGEVVHGSPHYVVLFALASILLVFSLATNLVAQSIVERFRKQRGGS